MFGILLLSLVVRILLSGITKESCATLQDILKKKKDKRKIITVFFPRFPSFFFFFLIKAHLKVCSILHLQFYIISDSDSPQV